MKDEHKVRVTSNGTWAHTHVMIGNQEFRVDDMNIRFNREKLMLSLELTVYVPNLDIEVLERNTELKITKE